MASGRIIWGQQVWNTATEQGEAVNLQIDQGHSGTGATDAILDSASKSPPITLLTRLR